MVDTVMGVLFGLGWFYTATLADADGNISADAYFIGLAVLIAGFMAGRDNK